MSYFDHIEFNELLNDLALQPLTGREACVVQRLLANDVITDVEDEDDWVRGALVRLETLGLAWVEEVDVFSIDGLSPPDAYPSELLQGIVERGLLAQIGVG